MGVCFSACFGAEKGGDKGGPVQVQANVATSPGRWDFEAANGAGDKNKGMDGVPEATVRERAKAAVLGGLVADAATMGLHWIYNVGQLKDLLKDKQVGENKYFAAEFFEPPSCPFYKYPTGKLSPYGFEARTVLESVAAVGGVDGAHMTQHMYEAFKQYQKDGGYLNSPSRELIANIDSGKTFPDAAAFDDQAQGMVKVAAVVARYAGSPEMVEKIREAVKTHQKHERAEASAVAIGLVLEKIVVGGVRARDAISSTMAGDSRMPSIAQNWIKSASSKDGTPVPGAIISLGQSCHLPGSFQGPIYAAYFAKDYVQGIRENILAGGDSCSRAVVAGAMLAAQDGLAAIPDDWKMKVDDYKVMEDLVDKILACRTPVA